MRRLHDECVEGVSVTDVSLEEFDWRFEQYGSICSQGGILFEQPS